ncbi:MAG: phosphoribosylformimino-5-aminoimidazole carboxamide ribotide isomerase [Candidatus Aureabacteria bacterium]|nr:phosphoribosylformimino-5-aminoimidazole carboxamide ribotide isomerase [Candidatus Auribacterota bacterium]
MFRPCIDLHEGKVKQIVGVTLSEDEKGLLTNFVSEKPSFWYANLFQKDSLMGGHIVMLGQGNESAAIEALHAYPGGFQIGGGITPVNAALYLDNGASHVIVTSYIFHDGVLRMERLELLQKIVGKKRLVLDLSCRKKDNDYYIVTDRWQKFTQVKLSRQTIQEYSGYCDELLIHAVDVEGTCTGIDWTLVQNLSEWAVCPITYAGGAKSIKDLEQIEKIGRGRIHLTIGSALDIFGGTLIRYQDAVNFNKKLSRSKPK